MLFGIHKNWHITDNVSGVMVQVTVFFLPSSEVSTMGDQLQQSIWKSLFFLSS